MGRSLLFDKETPEEMHARIAVGNPCLCGAPGIGHIRSLILEKDLIEKHPEITALIMAQNPNGPAIPSFASRYGPLVIISTITPCKGCFPAAERAAAKHPDWVLIEINKGPGTQRVVSSVPLKLVRPPEAAKKG